MNNLRHGSQEPPSETSSTSSPDAAAYDDCDFSLAHSNDSQSSIGVPAFGEMSMSDEPKMQYVAPIYRLPPEILIAIMAKLSSSGDLMNCMLVSKLWASASVELLWHRPLCNYFEKLTKVVRSLQKKDGYFAYHDLVKRLNLAQVADSISDGTLHSFSECKRIERLTLTGCTKVSDSGLRELLSRNTSLMALDLSALELITDASLLMVAQNCRRLQGLNITGCNQITDMSLIPLSQNCTYIKRLKLNDCEQVTNEAILSFAQNCPQLLEIDLNRCHLITDPAVTALVQRGRQLRELRLTYCENITDEAFLSLPPMATYDSLRILDLTACDFVTDIAIHRIVTAAPRLRNLVLAKCRRITDKAVFSIAKLGKNLHYIHLGHCAQITDKAVSTLIKNCNRIRYIDLACCNRLTDNSIETLANLPKLRRIGLVKCTAITDRSILALAQPRQGHPSPVTHSSSYPLSYTVCSSLERVHLSYCTQLTVLSIHALLNHCPRLTHLSLTGVQAFLRLDITSFCREAPIEFTDHQRDVFCVFSGEGVRQLRHYLNTPAVRAQTEADAVRERQGQLDAQAMHHGLLTVPAPDEEPQAAADGGLNDEVDESELDN